jgi:uncharacterized lipoprotein
MRSSARNVFVKFRAAWVLAAAVPALSGCQALHALTARSCTKPRHYMLARSVAPLKIPIGLNAPNTRDSLVVPALKGPTPPPPAGQPCLDAPPSYLLAHAEPSPKD